MTFESVLWLTSLPAAGNTLGALVAEWIRITEKRLSLALHASAGVLLGVVAVELMPEALQKTPPWLVITSFVVGGLLFILLDHTLESVRTRAGKKTKASGPWTIYFSVAIDLLSDGIMIGVAGVVSTHLGFVLATGQALADVPQGLATMAMFQKSVSQGERLLANTLLVVPLYAGAALGYFILRGRSHLLQFAILGLTAGLLTTLAVEEVVPQAHERGESHAAAAAFVLAFAGFIALSSYL